jgi:hypothetical protein
MVGFNQKISSKTKKTFLILIKIFHIILQEEKLKKTLTMILKLNNSKNNLLKMKVE